ncbi:MAG: DUF2088 domain-containing protein [Pirellulales bacterium]|nr:DUF2088 domain-containing protein [Pirellulales bacterium]
MALSLAIGSPTDALTHDEIREALSSLFQDLGPRHRVAAVPPDYSRAASRAGDITRLVYDHYGDSLVDVIPALGTHKEMTLQQREKMFPGVPASLFRYHNWRTDVETLGEVPAEFVDAVTEGTYSYAWPVQLNRRLWEGRHDLILSIGQVVPHEVIGMANYNKNLFVGVGGERGINESHYIGAVYGMERIMGRAETPLRKILNEAQDRFCSHLPILYILTVIGPDEAGNSVVRGLFAGDDKECFLEACDLSQQVNITYIPKPLDRVIVYLDPEKYQSTWLGNKAIYRTRMAMADQGELTMIAPGVETFGEDPEIDHLIRKYGYRTTPEILSFVLKNEDLRHNLSAAAHLIHGSSENRFRITFCPGGLSEQEITGVGYQWADHRKIKAIYGIDGLENGPHTCPDGRPFYFINDPALGLWTATPIAG